MATTSNSTCVALLAVAATLAVATGCTSSTSGRPYSEVSADARQRADGVELGSIGSIFNLSGGLPYVTQIEIVRRSTDGVPTGNSIIAVVMYAGAPFGFERLVATGPAGERIIAAKVLDVRSRFSLSLTRYIETSEVPLTDEDVRWFVDAGEALVLRADGKTMWFKVPPGADLAAALRQYNETYVVAAPASSAR